MTEDRYTVVLVHSTSHALRAESVLADAGIPCKLIPVPRELSSNCGVCVRVRRTDRQMTRQVLEGRNLEIKGVHDI